MELRKVDKSATDVETREQLASRCWLRERICRLTASNFGRINSRRRNFFAAVNEILYKKPPSSLPSLLFGRLNEKHAVTQYAVLHPELEVRESALVIHPTLPYLAASPDRKLN